MNLTQKLVEAHLAAGGLEAGGEIALTIDRTLTQDATGTMVMLELEALGIDRASGPSCPRSTSTTVASALNENAAVEVQNLTKGESYRLEHRLGRREVDMVLAGGLTNPLRESLKTTGSTR